MRRRRNEYASFEDAQAGIRGWSGRQAAANARMAERESKADKLALLRLIRDRDDARNAYTAAVERRDILAGRIAASASKLGSMRRNRSTGGETPAAMVALIDTEKHAPLWLAEADAEVDRMRSAMHDAQARHDAGMAAHAAALSGEDAEPEAVEPAPETVDEAPRGRSRQRKAAA